MGMIVGYRCKKCGSGKLVVAWGRSYDRAEVTAPIRRDSTVGAKDEGGDQLLHWLANSGVKFYRWVQCSKCDIRIRSLCTATDHLGLTEVFEVPAKCVVDQMADEALPRGETWAIARALGADTWPPGYDGKPFHVREVSSP